MNLIDILTAPWAILPDKLLEIQAIYATHLRGEKIDIDAVEARLGRPLANDQQDYRVESNGVAVLSVSGVIANKANMFTRISGGASAQLLQKQVESMRADPRVRAVVLDMDTPGGSVLGVPALGESIRALAAEKPTVSCCTGTMCSAGYWLGSAANAVYISGLTDYVGSIGVVAQHQYDPKSANVQTTEITAGKYKRMATDNAPLSKEGKAYIQGQVDHLYSVFVETVAQNRRVSTDAVLQHMADGKVFIGQQAIDAGLVDGVATVDALVERLGENPDQYASRRKAKFASGSAQAEDGAPAAEIVDEPVLPVIQEPEVKGAAMSAKELAEKFAAENPEAAAILRAEGTAAGAAAELARIKDVRAASLPGHEALIESLAFDGKTSGAEAALAVVAAERTKVTAAATARAADAVKPVEQASAESDPGAEPEAKGHVAGPHPGTVIDAKRAKLDADAKAYMKSNPGVDYLAAVKAVSKE